MCGLSAIISLSDEQVTEKSIKYLNNKIKHRGPDSEGYYYGDKFAFGHQRLSIIDLSNKGDQPMHRGDDCIIFNGMIFNYLELRNELSALGNNFVSECDTEVILAAYQQWGINAFKKFNGMWAFVIYDAASQTLVFSRDRFGIKPLYFTSTNKYFLAGSEIKQFMDFPGFQPVLNLEVASRFLVSGITNYSEETFFDGVKELRPGQMLIYNLQTHKQKLSQWYDLEREIRKQPCSSNDAVEKVRDLFIDSVRVRCKADVKLGSCLSGGHDSSSIVSVLHSQQMVSENFPTVTSCYENKDFDEREYSETVIDETGYTSLKVFPDLNDLFKAGDLDKMIYHFDQPFGSASHYSEYNVYKKAKENGIKVLLDGQGADEYLCGYYQYLYAYLRELVRKRSFKKVWHNLTCKANKNKTSVYKELFYFLRFSLSHQLITRVKKLFKVKQHSWLNLEIKLNDRRSYDDLVGTTSQISLRQFLYSSLGYQLHSQDRNSMLFSIESRLPFLDHRLVEYIMGLPSDYKIKNGYSKHVLLEAIRELPDQIKHRNNKMSFAAPDPLWMRENHVQIRAELENAIQYTGMFNSRLLKKFDSFINGDGKYDNLFFRVISFYRFCRIFKIKFRAATCVVVPSLHHLIDSNIA